jgi:hypothetical protein
MTAVIALNGQGMDSKIESIRKKLCGPAEADTSGKLIKTVSLALGGEHWLAPRPVQI